MNARIALAVVCTLAAGASPAVAQTTPAPAAAQSAAVRSITLYELVLRDGSRVFGTIDRQDEREVVFTTQAGATMTARREDIASLKQVSGALLQGEFIPPDANATRLFFAPTGRSLKRGQTYLGVYEFLMPFVQVGVTDRFSIGGGTPLVFGMDEGDRPFWITPKLQVLDAASTQVSVGVIHVFNVDDRGLGIGYVVATRGSAAGSFSAGGGIAYETDGSSGGVAMIGGERTVHRHLKLITENYIWKGRKGIVSGGLRFFGERLSADFALAVPLWGEQTFAFPVMNFVYLF